MAEGNKHFHEFGYPDERFESVLSDNLHCAICSCVLKDPVMCKNEHCFCRGCITKHLENYHTCPSCNQDLTVESLAVAPRIVRNLLSEQKIRCDYYERGCEEIVQLGNLASHVAVCGKTPVVCANEKCSSEINREDQFRHESEECRFREVKCRNCKEMSSMVQDIETNLGGLCEHVETSLGGLCEHVKKLNTSVDEQIEKSNTSVKEMKTGLAVVGNRLEEVENKLGEMENKFGEMENKFEEMEKKFENRFEEMENKFENRLEKMENRFEQVEKQLLNTFRDGENVAVHYERESARSNQATLLDSKSDLKDAKNPYANAYVVAGGYGKNGQPLNSVEIFDKTTNSWIQLNQMNKTRAEASLLVYNGQILVTGGISDENTIVSNIEQFNRSPNPNPFVPPFWSNFPVKLPKASRGHRTILYNNRIFVIGGYDEEKKMHSDIIYEIQLHFPLTTKILAKIPSSRPMDGCGVVLHNDNILIFGGCDQIWLGSFSIPSATAKVTMYNITKNEFEELAPLPYALWNMATVKMGENVILVGSTDRKFKDRNKKTENVKNAILSYNIETQEITELPLMKHARSECCAVVDGNSLVVMGGQDQRENLLNSVEAFDFKTSTWSYLPSMNKARRGFVAVIV